jgi:hypothetical protein
MCACAVRAVDLPLSRLDNTLSDAIDHCSFDQLLGTMAVDRQQRMQQTYLIDAHDINANSCALTPRVHTYLLDHTTSRRDMRPGHRTQEPSRPVSAEVSLAS